MTIDTNDLLRKLAPLLGDRSHALWWLLHSAPDKDAAWRLEQLLALLADRLGNVNFAPAIRLPPPSPDKLSGTLPLARVRYPDRTFAVCGLHPSELQRHLLIVGMTGTGKTTATIGLLRQLAHYQIPFLVFDWKRSYHRLQNHVPADTLVTYRIGEPDCPFTFNPLIPPPGLPARYWLALLIDVIQHVYFVSFGQEYFFRQAIHALYQRFRVYDGNRVFPNFFDVEKLLRQEYVKGREMLWMASVKRVLSILTTSPTIADLMNDRFPSSLPTLLKRPVIFELDRLATIERVFFIEALLLWIYQYRALQGKSDVLRHVIVLEEAHAVLSRAKEAVQGSESIMETSLRLIREFGQGVIVIDQEPSKLSNSILANTATKLCFHLGSGKDIATMAEAMYLPKTQAAMIDLLGVGEAIGKFSSRFPESVHLRFAPA